MTYEELLAQVEQSGTPMSPELDPLLRQLLSQGMTQGLTNQPTTGLTFRGGVAGSSKPPPADEINRIGVSTTPAQVAQDDYLKTLAMPGASNPNFQNMSQVAALVKNLAGVPAPIAQALIQQLTGFDMTPPARATGKPPPAEMTPGQQGQMDLAQDRLALDRQKEERLAGTPAKVSVRPLKDANKIITGMSDMGASPEQIQQAAEAMGYTIAGTPRTWYGGAGTPVLGMQPRASASASSQTGASPSTGAAAGEVVVEKGGKRFAISPDKAPDAIKRGYKLAK